MPRKLPPCLHLSTPLSSPDTLCGLPLSGVELGCYGENIEDGAFIYKEGCTLQSCASCLALFPSPNSQLADRVQVLKALWLATSNDLELAHNVRGVFTDCFKDLTDIFDPAPFPTTAAFVIKLWRIEAPMLVHRTAGVSRLARQLEAVLGVETSGYMVAVGSA